MLLTLDMNIVVRSVRALFKGVSYDCSGAPQIIGILLPEALELGQFDLKFAYPQ